MTTGQPIRVPTDRNKYNNEFMENLKLQIRLNDSNLQANRLYTNTGQLPASTQMSDTRSTSEKLADVEGLKRSIVADLSPVAESSFAYAIITGVINSPLNLDNSLFRYLAQNAQVLAQQLSKKYKFGIAGDANDVGIIVNFLEDAYNKTNNTFQTIKGYMNSTSNTIQSKGNILGSNNTDAIISELRDIEKRLDYMIRLAYEPNGNPVMGNILTPLFNAIKDIVNFLPSSRQLDTIIQNLQNVGAGTQPDLFYRVLDILKALPRPDSLKTLIDKIEKGYKLNDVNYVNSAVSNIIQLTGTLTDPQNQAILNNFNRVYLQEANNEIRNEERLNQVNTMRNIYEDRQARDSMKKAERVYVMNPYDDPVQTIDSAVAIPGGGGGRPVAGAYGGYGGNPPPAIAAPAPAPAPALQAYPIYIANQVNALTQAELNQLYAAIPNAMLRVPLTPALTAQFALPNPTPPQQRGRCIAALFNAAGIGGGNYDPQNGIGNFGIQGLGIKKGRGISSDYREFGINKINHKKLDDGILTVRRKSNTNIPDMPSKRISRKLQKIIKHISGGGIPDYNDLNNLEDGEKDYLHKLISKSNMNERLSVPAPSKDLEEKDFHMFEVMKGEIMSGNDSKDLVKKFKILILKLSKQNILPKNEVQELLQDLLSLGY